ncbi:Cytochrome c553 [Cupriavidus sp. YR651]|nr:Cytochrome c553 [Cupriavidus sp. YR651]
MTKFRWNLIAAALVMLGVVSTLHAASGTSARQQADEKIVAILPLCASCHGIDGVSSVGLYPNLAAQKPEYLAKQLRDFKAGRRDDPVMRSMAEPLDDAAIEALSRHFGNLPGAR